MSAKIYCIECFETGEKYIGSTKKKLSRRIGCHIYDEKKSGYKCSCKDIIERGNYKYYLIEEVNESQRNIREQYWIDNTDNCINYQRVLGLDKDKIKGHKKKHYKTHIDKIKEYQKEHYKYKLLWGGDPRYNNNLLKIDPSLFG